MMRIKFVVNMTAFALFFMLSVWQAHAFSNRTWVSGNGDDANAGQDCPLSAPCKTFAVALAQTNPGGEVNVASPGSFGPVVIDKAVKIDAGGMFAGIQVTNGGTGVIVNAPSNAQVVLRGLTINGLFTYSAPTPNGATGIKFNTGNALYVENCVVGDLSNIGIDFTPSALSYLFVKDVVVRNCQLGGIRAISSSGQFDKPARAIIDHARLEGNAYGVNAATNSNVTVRDSIASGSGNAGFLEEVENGNGAVLRLESCVATQNVVGVKMRFISGGSMRIDLSNVTIYGNITAGIQKLAPSNVIFSIISYGNNHNSDTGMPDTTYLPQ